jgi:hypothetical protein
VSSSSCSSNRIKTPSPWSRIPARHKGNPEPADSCQFPCKCSSNSTKLSHHISNENKKYWQRQSKDLSASRQTCVYLSVRGRKYTVMSNAPAMKIHLFIRHPITIMKALSDINNRTKAAWKLFFPMQAHHVTSYPRSFEIISSPLWSEATQWLWPRE